MRALGPCGNEDTLKLYTHVYWPSLSESSHPGPSLFVLNFPFFVTYISYLLLILLYLYSRVLIRHFSPLELKLVQSIKVRFVRRKSRNATRQSSARYVIPHLWQQNLTVFGALTLVGCGYNRSLVAQACYNWPTSIPKEAIVKPS